MPPETGENAFWNEIRLGREYKLMLFKYLARKRQELLNLQIPK